MRTTSLIGHFIELYDLVRGSTRPADNVVKEFFRARHYLGSKDRRFINEVTYGILRNHRLLHYLIENTETVRLRGGFRGSTPSVALYAAYVVVLVGTPPGEVSPDLESLWRVYAPTVECGGFLVELARVPHPSGEADPVRRLSLVYSFPEFVVREWIERFGFEEAEQMCGSLNLPAPTCIRVNTLKATVEECRENLQREGVDSRPTLLSPVGLILEKRTNVGGLQTFRRGFFELQDEGSQIISYLVDPAPGSIVVDACAGGGGKTLHLAALMQNRGELYAIDVDDRRLGNIGARVQRAGITTVRILSQTRDRALIEGLKGRADAVLVDVPCSGVGTFRRNPGVKRTLTGEFVNHIAGKQRAILERSADLVRPGGTLVYSTCTLLERENENVVRDVLEARTDFKMQPAAGRLRVRGIHVEQQSDFLTLLPHRTGTDGFFAGVFVRSAWDGSRSSRHGRN